MRLPPAVLQELETDADILAVYFFGSRASDRGRDDSDWDLAILWSELVGASDRFRRRTRLMESLAQRLGARVDVVDLRSAPVLLAAQALGGELVLEREPALRATFEMRIRGREDDERIARRWLRSTLASLRR